MTGELFINGKFEKQENGSYFEVENPSTEEIIGYASDASDAQVDYALESASAAYTDWAMLSIMQREKYLKVLIELIQEDKENLARLLTLEQGKTYKDALCAWNYPLALVGRKIGPVFHNGHKLSGIGGEDGEYGVGEYLQKRVTYAKY